MRYYGFNGHQVKRRHMSLAFMSIEWINSELESNHNPLLLYYAKERERERENKTKTKRKILRSHVCMICCSHKRREKIGKEKKASK